ncbi:MAG: SUF system NifU family Fe-S cluster assembly protein [Eggerthellaceae bacterium]|nr:SUF system NifU family Fe-S cluster assembly protein [Eggerthellaceae bacterium]
MAEGSIYTAALMEHNAHPDYKYEMEHPTHTHEGVNPSCGDDIILSLRVVDGIVEEAAFTGSGCAVSLASADIMADLITDEPVEEAKRLCDLFMKMIRGEATDEELEDLGEAAELKSIALMPARVKCAELGWRTLDTILADSIQAETAKEEL